MDEFKNGKELKLISGGTVTVKKKIGEGGQGTVYIVDYGGKQYALKWYLANYLRGLKPDCKAFYNNLVQNVEGGAPSDRFLWMKAVAVTGKKSSGFGYLMELRPKNYCEFTKFIKAKEKFSSTAAVINAAINVVEAFQALHRTGKSYQDLSPGNFFIDKDTGDVLICDNDNVAPYGVNLGVGGTPGYMAPEVILGQAKPGMDTDLFSLAVILFELFFLSHPLEGANCCKHPCLTQKLERQLYAENPVFVCSDVDTSNAPVRGTCSNLMRLWPMYPQSLHEKFRQAFSHDALHHGKFRLSEKVWKDTLYDLLDKSVICPACGEMNFTNMAEKGSIPCVGCKRKIAGSHRIIINNFEIAVDGGKCITEYHLSHGDRNIMIGTVVESKKTKGVFGLKNTSQSVWLVRYPGKDELSYESGKTVTIIPGTAIQIGNQIIEIK